MTDGHMPGGIESGRDGDCIRSHAWRYRVSVEMGTV